MTLVALRVFKMPDSRVFPFAGSERERPPATQSIGHGDDVEDYYRSHAAALAGAAPPSAGCRRRSALDGITWNVPPVLHRRRALDRARRSESAGQTIRRCR